MKPKHTVSIVGSDSLIGGELRDLIAEERFPVRLRLVGLDDDSLTLTERGGEAVVLTALDRDNLLDSDVVFLAGSPESSRKALALMEGAARRPAVIDVTQAAEEDPPARLRAPMAEPAGFRAPADALHVIAHPAATAIALFLLRLGAVFRIGHSVAHVFEPASGRGRGGVEELRSQVASLLSFKPLPKRVFDAQLGFNMLSSYGSSAPESLHSIEARIERHLASLLSLSGSIPLPSLRLIQAPVFHGYSISMYVEFGQKPTREGLLSALEGPAVDVRGADLEPPTSAGIAGQSGIAVGSVALDRNCSRAAFFWLAADNLRLTADNALAVAREALGGGSGAANK